MGAKVNINSADEAELMSVKGIGKAKAKAIVEYRQKNGPFKSVDDLTKIKESKRNHCKNSRISSQSDSQWRQMKRKRRPIGLLFCFHSYGQGLNVLLANLHMIRSERSAASQ